jgi:hypothetical protein
MSLVTPQGLAAQRELETSVEAAVKEVKVGVAKGALLPNELLRSLRSQWDDDIVREAMWQLLESHELELLSDRRLSLAS